MAFLSLAAGEASAQTAAPTKLAQSLSGEARTEYDAARALYRDGDYARALEKFRHARDLAEDPRLLWNMAACEKKLAHFVKVLKLVDEYLGTATTLLTEEDRREATQFAAAVRARVGAATITTRPVGVTIFVDGEAVASTPLAAPLLLDAGSRRVRFSKDGYRDVERSEPIAAESTATWSIDLERVESAPPPPAVVAPPPETAIAPAPPARAERGDPAAPRLSRTPLVVAGVGVSVAIVGGVLVGLSGAEFSRLEADCHNACAPARWHTWRTLETTGDVLLVAGGAAAAVGIAWYFLAPRASKTQASAWVSPRPGGVAAGVHF